MNRQLSLNYYNTENGYLIEYTGSGTTPITRHYGFAEWEDTAKKLIEILSETIDEKLIKRDDVETILLSLDGLLREKTVVELIRKIVMKLSELKEL